MDSVPIRHYRRNESEEKTLDPEDNNDKDHISNLPDCVLAHILSKLPTKFAVGTSVLSTRWKHLFALIPAPKLEFNDSLILHPKYGDRSNAEKQLAEILAEHRSNAEKRVVSFAKFTYRVLDVILKEVPFIASFVLKLRIGYEDEQILDWIYAALQRYVPILDLDISMDEPHLLFELISDCESLVYLALNNNMSTCVTKSFSLPNLEYLALNGVQFYNNEEIYMLLSSFPVLKCLTMCYLILEVDSVIISIPSLKRLQIEHCWYKYNGINDYYQFALDTPALEFLYYKDHVTDEFVLKNLKSLRDAHISVLPLDQLELEQLELLDEAESLEYCLEYNRNVAALVRACSNVNKLFLSKDTISAIQKSGEQLPMFCNLISLELSGFDMDGWKLLPQLLENAPKLEILSITKEFYEEKGCYDIFMSHNKIIAPCLRSSLRKIEIFKLKGEFDELCLIGYLLRTGKVLKEFEVMCVSGLPMEKYFIVRELLPSMPRLSETCKIFLYDIK